MIFRDDRWAVVQAPGARIDFQTAAGYVPPAWPDPASSMQMDLDFYVDDADSSEARLLAGLAAAVCGPRDDVVVVGQVERLG